MAMQLLSHSFPMEIKDQLFNSSKLNASLDFCDNLSESGNVALYFDVMIPSFATATSGPAVGCMS